MKTRQIKVKMAEPTEAQALSKISNEIDESQINVILTGQCLKAQAFLLDKLRKQAERRKEVCGFISSANMKLECEIKQAELEIYSLRNAIDTIKHANVELKKDYLLAKENNYEIAERINAGEKKYEQLWLEAKSRYESIPFVKKLLQAQNRVQTLHDTMAKYQNQAKSLAKETEIKRADFKISDKKRIIELAEFVVYDMPTKNKIIDEMLGKIKDLQKEIETIEIKSKSKNSTLPNMCKDIIENETEASQENKVALNGDDWGCLKEINDDALMVPKLDKTKIDLDFISDKLQKVKKVDVFYTQIEEIPAMSGNENDNQQTKKYDWNVVNMEPYISPYFLKKIDVDNETSYSNKKLINIIDDVSIEKKDAYNILSNVNPQKLQEVNMINSNLESIETLKQNAKVLTESEVVTSCSDNIVLPPTQFLDLSQENIFNSQANKGIKQITASEINANEQHLKSSQDAKKRVSFHLSTSMEIPERSEKLEENFVKDISPIINDTLDTSAVSDEDFVKIKDMVLKKHNLEKSPQFVYAKNTIQSNNTIPPNIIKSKYFEDKNDMKRDNAIVDSANKVAGMDCLESKQENPKDNDHKMTTEEQDIENQNNIEAMEVDDAIESNVKVGELEKTSVTGLLFTHGRNAIPESLNVSISTSGYEDGDSDFPHYIDSNLLLSPKADIQMCDDNPEVQSQEVPNFLTGLRKTGLSLFEDLPSSTPNTDGNKQNQNPGSFKFSFGGGEKKSRGGFFNMFN